MDFELVTELSNTTPRYSTARSILQKLMNTEHCLLQDMGKMVIVNNLG